MGDMIAIIGKTSSQHTEFKKLKILYMTGVDMEDSKIFFIGTYFAHTFRYLRIVRLFCKNPYARSVTEPLNLLRIGTNSGKINVSQKYPLIVPQVEEVSQSSLGRIA